MSYLGNVLKFEMFNGKNMLKNAWNNPDQMLLGAADPFSARVWSTITGKDYKPIVDQMGGATQDTYRKADAAGLDTHDGRQVQNLAHVIAGLYAGGYGASAAGVGSAGGVGGSGILSSASPAATSTSGLTPQATTAAPTWADKASNFYDQARYKVGGLLEDGQGYWNKATTAYDQYGKPISNGINSASQAKGLLSGQAQQPAQPGQIGRQDPDFSGLLASQGQLDAQRLAEEEKRKQQQQMIVQGLLGGAYGR